MLAMVFKKREDRIRSLAYKYYLHRDHNGIAGNEIQDWLDAEKDVNRWIEIESSYGRTKAS